MTGLQFSEGVIIGYFLFDTASRPAPIQRVPGIITPGIKRPGREDDHVPPFSAEFKNEYFFMVCAVATVTFTRQHFHVVMKLELLFKYSIFVRYWRKNSKYNGTVH
jgi:hypothetical protein